MDIYSKQIYKLSWIKSDCESALAEQYNLVKRYTDKQKYSLSK